MRNFYAAVTAIVALIVIVLLGGCVQVPVEYPTERQAAYAYRATVKVTTTVSPLEVYSATAWFVDDHILVSAGHVCDPPDAEQMIETYDGKQYRAIRVYSTFAAGDKSVPDVCVLVTAAYSPAALHLAPTARGLEFGASVWAVGYPDGFTALMRGRLSGMDDNDEMLIATITGWFGASGSALLDDQSRVLGVLSRTATANGAVLQFTPVEAIKDALTAAFAPIN